jgi:hypothetical protein
LLAGCFGVIAGVVLGVAVAVPLQLQVASEAASAIREEDGHGCGLITLPYLAQGIMWGAALGGPTGLVASVLVAGLLARHVRPRPPHACSQIGMTTVWRPGR